MAAVFTVRRVRFLNSLLLSFLLLSCHAPAQQEKADYAPLYNADSVETVNKNGILYYNQMPFTGTLFRLNSAKDTVMICGYYKGKEHGQWKRYYDNGQLAELRYFEQGIKTKTLSRWWKNGQQQLQCTFEQDAYQGLFQEWNEQGQLVMEMHYNKGYEEGSQKMFYDNGKIRSNYVIRNGKRIGLLGTKNCVNASDSVFKK